MKKKLVIYLNAPITITFVLICLFALVLNSFTGGTSNFLFFSVYKSSLLDPLAYIRIFGHIFGHQGFEHFMNNMLYILLLGPILEEKYKDKLIYVIMATALSTGIMHIFLSPNTALLGASGVVFAFIILSSVTGKQNGIPVTLLIVGLLWIGGEIRDGILAHDNISQLTHIIGGIIGGALGMYFKK